jgi:hypothetical protein
MEYELEYYWIVLCKNHHYHNKQNLSTGHPILLGETDSVSSPPYLETDFKVRCEDCDREYSYSPRELLRYETEPPASFLAHPIFADLGSVQISKIEPGFSLSHPKTTITARSFTQIVRNLFHRSRQVM